MSEDLMFCICMAEANTKTNEAIRIRDLDVEEQAEDFVAGTCDEAIKMSALACNYECDIITETLGTPINNAVLKLLRQLGYDVNFDYERDHAGNISTPERKKFSISWLEILPESVDED